MNPDRVQIVGQRAATEQPADSMRVQRITAIAVVVLLLAGFGFGGWWYFHRDQLPAGEVMVDIHTGGETFGAGIGRRVNGVARAVRGTPATSPSNPSEIQNQNVFRAGNARLFVSRAGMPASTNPLNATAGEWRFRFVYQPSLMTSQDSATILARWNSQALQLSADQTKQLEALPTFNDHMFVSKDDQAAVKKQWDAYVAAKPEERPAMGKAIEATLADIAKRSETSTRNAIDARVKKVQSILTPEQFTQLNKK